MLNLSISTPKDLGLQLRVFRVAHGLTQTELADRAHTNQQTISAVERGNFSAEWLECNAHIIRGVFEALGVVGDPYWGVESPFALNDSVRLGNFVDEASS